MIDWVRVNLLQTEIGEADFAEVVELFVRESDEAITRLWQSDGTSSHEMDLHFLKGSALSLGFASFAEDCALAERRAASGELASTEIHVLFDIYQKSRAEFLAAMENWTTSHLNIGK